MTADAEAFADLVEPCMTSDPFSTNVIGVQLAGALDGSRPVGDDAIWLAVDGSDGGSGGVVGVGMHTPPRNLFLSRLPPGAASQVAAALLAAGRQLPGVSGEAATVAEFADAWTARTGTRSATQVSMRMYRLGTLIAPGGVAGEGRKAAPDDLGLVQDWFVHFNREAVPHALDDDAGGLAERRLAIGHLWLWVDEGRPVALAAVSSAAAGVARIGPVYTPPAHRRRGYGAAATSRATQAALEDGADQVVLYTDLANPTSNAIYQSIGYRPDHDAEDRIFTPKVGRG
ncbi:MAG: GNAT family N-acetyltransferase [Actinomycetes bacterium]